MAREDVNIKVTANVAEAIQMWKAMEAGPEGMAKQLSAMGQKGKQHVDSAGDAIVAMGTKLLSATALIGGVVSALKQVEDRAQAAAARVSETLGSFGELQQVSRTPQEFASNVARSREFVRRGIVSPEEGGMGADITFAMVSAGYTEQEKDYIMQLGESRFVKPEGLMGLSEGLGKYRNAFGRKDAGELPEIVDKVTQAAGTAQATIPETMKGILEASGSASELKMSDEETIAGLLGVEAQSPNMELASSKYRSFLNQVNKERLWKGSLKSTVADIQRRVAGGRNVFDILQEGRAVEAYGDLASNMGFVDEQQALLSTASQRQLFASQSRLMQDDPELRAADSLAKAKGKQAAAQGAATNRAQLLFDSYQSEMEAYNLKNYGGFWGGLMNVARTAAEAPIDWAQGEKGLFRNLTKSQRAALSPGLLQDIDDFTGRTIRIVGPDGLDIPTEPAATGLSQ